jgi:phage N-6-adenine-methyltransferase
VNRADALEITDALGQVGEGWWRQIAVYMRNELYRDAGLTRAEWVARIGPKLALPVEERKAAAVELTTSEDEGGLGLSQRQTADVLGVTHTQIQRDVGTYVPPPSHDQPEPDADGTYVPKPHVANNSGDNDWYTPEPYIGAARVVLGTIDLDPASTADANEVVGATAFYTLADDGLTKPWHGRVWMNPPYSQPQVDRFCTRIAREVAAGAVTEACALVNNATETAWFQEMLSQAAAVCFPRGRVRFWHPSKTSAAPLQGQAVVYLGPNPTTFADAFRRFGPVASLVAGR